LVATELPRQQGLFECVAAANGNQLVAAEELLNLTPAYSRHIQHQVQIRQSPMSYLLLRASVGRKRKNPTQKILVWSKKLEILAQLKQWLPEIAAGKMSVFFLDECHLLWGDVCGYIWGKSNRRIEVPIERQKQTYYGALITLITSFGSSLS